MGSVNAKELENLFKCSHCGGDIIVDDKMHNFACYCPKCQSYVDVDYKRQMKVFEGVIKDSHEWVWIVTDGGEEIELHNMLEAVGWKQTPYLPDVKGRVKVTIEVLESGDEFE